MDDERQLILRVRAGNKEAFGALVKAYQNRIFFSALRLLRDAEDAKEIAQDTFLAAFKAIKGFRLRSSFYTWIYRIALNLSYHRLRSAKYRNKFKTLSLDAPLQIEEGSPNPRQTLLTKEKIEIVQKALALLKPKFYQAVVLSDIEGLSYEEIAEIQKCALGTVMSRLHRGRLQLAEKLKNSGINLT